MFEEPACDIIFGPLSPAPPPYIHIVKKKQTK